MTQCEYHHTQVVKCVHERFNCFGLQAQHVYNVSADDITCTIKEDVLCVCGRDAEPPPSSPSGLDEENKKQCWVKGCGAEDEFTFVDPENDKKDGYLLLALSISLMACAPIIALIGLRVARRRRNKEKQMEDVERAQKHAITPMDDELPVYETVAPPMKSEGELPPYETVTAPMKTDDGISQYNDEGAQYDDVHKSDSQEASISI
eukprot:316962_1